MILKKFYGVNINEALRDAKEQLGDDVILLESVKPEEDRPASVTVMLDEKLNATSQQQQDKSGEENFQNTLYKRSDVRKQQAGGGTSDSDDSDVQVKEKEPEEAQKQKKESAREQTSPSNKQKSSETSDKESTTDRQKDEKSNIQKPEAKLKPKKKQESSGEKSTKKDKDDLPEPKGLDVPPEGMSRHDESLMDKRNSSGSNNGYSYRDASVSREINALHRRFDQVESMLSEALISANLDYASHPAFQQLVNTGIRATTVAGWFKEILNKGIDPYEEHDSFMYELARVVRDALTITLPQAAQPNMVFVGASGAGKTSVIMKLATNDEFFGDKKVALVSVEPRNSEKKYTVLEPFAEDEGIDYFTVRDGIDVTKLMPKLVNYDQVLFDTPSISLEKKTAFREYWKIRQILASVLPLEVHFVINATMENYYFREAYATNHPLQPDYVAITHLDETDRWGHLIPFLKTLGCSVRYMSQGANVPDDLNAFSPTWFAEKILAT